MPGDLTRPITDRVKEALFNIIGPDVRDSSWWDVFAGTGAVAIEALSRGAAFARLTDLNKAPMETIKRNLELTGLSARAEPRRADAYALLASAPDRRLIEEANHPVGYFVVTFWYSLEFHGGAAFLDELHISAAHRGRGIGKRALAYVQDFCAANGIKALRLEVEHENIQAHNLYARAGFKEHTRHLMTKWLDDSR